MRAGGEVTLARKRRVCLVRSWGMMLAVTIAVAGCASAIKGTRQTVAFSSDPPGASVIVDGTNLGTTPAEIELARHDSHSVRIEKVGYVPYETTTSSSLNNWQWLDVVSALGFPPAIFDSLFDAGAHDIQPPEVTAHLLAAPSAPNP